MTKEQVPFEDFMLTVSPAQLPMVQTLHQKLVDGGCLLELKSAKSGYVVTYRDSKGAALMNYVTRKTGQHVRIYADNLAQFTGLLEDLPPKLRQKLAKTGICRRMHDPGKCNSRCPMGYVFTLDGETHKKCRFNCFLWLVDEESYPAIEALAPAELAARCA